MMDTPNQGIAILAAFLFSLAGVFNLYQIRRLKEGKKHLFESLSKVLMGDRHIISSFAYYLGQGVGIIALTIFSLAGLYMLLLCQRRSNFPQFRRLKIPHLYL